MSTSLDPDDMDEDLRVVEAKLRTLKPREANLEWSAILDAQTTIAISSKAASSRRLRNLTLAVTWLSGVAAGCLVMLNFQSTTPARPPSDTTTVVNAGRQNTAVDPGTPATDIAFPVDSNESIVAIIDEPSIRLFSASHLSNNPLALGSKRVLAMAPKSDGSFVRLSTAPTMPGLRRELMDELLHGAPF